MKGLFKSKPRTPADLVRQTRDLLLYADRSTSLPDLRESKREEKVPFLYTILVFGFGIFIAIMSYTICAPIMTMNSSWVADGGIKPQYP